MEIYKAVIIVTMEGTAILVKSSPSLTEYDIFDGEFLADQAIENEMQIPIACGLYTCLFEVWGETPIHGEGDYSTHIAIRDVNRIEVKELI